MKNPRTDAGRMRDAILDGLGVGWNALDHEERIVACTSSTRGPTGLHHDAALEVEVDGVPGRYLVVIKRVG